MIRSFTDLKTWQKGHTLVIDIYKITADFPKHEIFGLSSQIQRAAVSVTSNIAEGFGRRTANERVRFYDIARASLAELQNQLLIARDIKYLDQEKFTNLADQTTEVCKMLNGLINKTRSLDSSS